MNTVNGSTRRRAARCRDQALRSGELLPDEIKRNQPGPKRDDDIAETPKDRRRQTTYTPRDTEHRWVFFTAHDSAKRSTGVRKELMRACTHEPHDVCPHVRHEGFHEVGQHERLRQEHAQLPHRHQEHPACTYVHTQRVNNKKRQKAKCGKVWRHENRKRYRWRSKEGRGDERAICDTNFRGVHHRTQNACDLRDAVRCTRKTREKFKSPQSPRQSTYGLFTTKPHRAAGGTTDKPSKSARKLQSCGTIALGRTTALNH